MPRPRCRRTIGYLPSVTYFKPAGVRISDLEEVLIRHDEIEAVRLKDLLGLSQEDAAKEMNVSQPTFHRLILSAHKKLADAVVSGKALKIEGGNINIGEDVLPPCGHWQERCGRGHRGQKRDIAPVYINNIKGGDMKIAISSMDGTLEGAVDERFGRCRKFVLYNKETKQFEAIDNASNMNSAQGAGIQSSQNVVNAGAKVVISGHLGPNAFRVLQEAGVDVYTTTGMTVAQAIKAFEEATLSKLASPDVQGHW
jgi:predicted DNA-binding protein (UPF0251 family)/predicted Fe-Mo cluster-binding NifX family protein